MIQSRTEKHKSVRKDHKTLWLKIALLSLITMGAFAYLTQWLESRQQENTVAAESPVASAKPPAAASGAPGTSTGADNPPSAGEKPATLTEGARPQPLGADTSNASDKVTLTFVGDVMFAGKVEDLLTKHGYDYPFKYVKSYLEKADLTIANLETPVTTRGSAQTKEYVYRSSPLALPELKKAGIDLVNLANNHSMDYGEEGLLDTLEHLDDQGILRVGGGRDADEAYRHVIVERHGMKIAFLGFTRVLPSTSWIATAKKAGLATAHTSKATMEAVAKARQEADLVVVIAHWGEERKSHPVKIQTDLAHEFIDAGADLVVASHPHVPQGFEQYKGKWVAYSLGNFVFTTNEVPETWDSMILNAACTKERSCELSLVPILTKWAQPVRMVEDQSEQLFQRLTKNSINAKVDKQGAISLGPVNTFPAASPKPAAPKATETTKPTAPKATETTKPAQSTSTPATKQPESTGTAKPGATEATKTPSSKKAGETSPAGKGSSSSQEGSGKSGASDKPKAGAEGTGKASGAASSSSSGKSPAAQPAGPKQETKQ